MTGETTDVELALVVITGVAWTIVYLDSIRIGLRQKTFAMPVIALGLNFSWELTYATLDSYTAFHDPTVNNIAWALVEIVWALADIAIISTFFMFGRAEFPAFINRELFVSWAVLVFGVCCVVQWLIIAQFGVGDAVRYSAFLQTVLMSGLYIAMLVARRGLRGQTLTIAIAKWIGTLAATALYGVVVASPFILGLGIICCVLDIVYIGLVIWAQRQPHTLAGTPRRAESVAA
jgi:hypothetical protein